MKSNYHTADVLNKIFFKYKFVYFRNKLVLTFKNEIMILILDLLVHIIIGKG
jgi:hypothetical protein